MEESSKKIKYKEEQLELEYSVLEKLYDDLKNTFLDEIFYHIVNVITIVGEIVLFINGINAMKTSALIGFMISLFVAVRLSQYLVCGTPKARLNKRESINDNIIETSKNIKKYELELEELKSMVQNNVLEENVERNYDSYVEEINNLYSMKEEHKLTLKKKH